MPALTKSPALNQHEKDSITPSEDHNQCRMDNAVQVAAESTGKRQHAGKEVYIVSRAVAIERLSNEDCQGQAHFSGDYHRAATPA